MNNRKLATASSTNTRKKQGVTVPSAPRGTSPLRSSLQVHRPPASIRHVTHVHYQLQQAFI